MYTVIIIGASGCLLAILAPILRWIACDRMNDRIYAASVLSLWLGEILIWLYLIKVFVTGV